MSKTIKIDPITRIEGHMAVEAVIDDGVVKDARSAGTLFRGFEIILKDRDPRDANRLTQRICGVCPACLKRGQVLLRLLKYLKPHWKRAAILIGLMIVPPAIQTLPPYLTKILVDDVLISDGISTIASYDATSAGLSRVAWLVIIVSFFLVSRLLLLGVEVDRGDAAIGELQRAGGGGQAYGAAGLFDDRLGGGVKLNEGHGGHAQDVGVFVT